MQGRGAAAGSPSAAQATVHPAMQQQATVGNQAVMRRAVVQRDGVGSPAPGTVRALASAGTRGRGHSLPHLDAVQRSFGAHDVTGVRAHTDGAARGAARGMLARAFTVGEHVGFGGSPSLRTVAHEAAHVVQQRRGLDLAGGVGQRGDRHEAHADRIADLVVRGESAESALGAPMSAHDWTRPGVQLETDEQQLIDAGKALRAPDTLNADTVFTITGALLANESGEEYNPATGTQTLTKGTRIRIVGEADGTTTIRSFKWNNGLGGWDQFEGTIPTSAVAYGSTEQTAIGLDQVIVPDNVEDIRQEDVYQAGLSDCYFQAALASVAAARPQAILDMIRDEGGSIVVTLYTYNAYRQRHEIRLKPSLFLDGDGKPVYHGKKDAPLWPAFVAKAWAVLNGGWSQIQMGLAGEAMFAITGEYASDNRLGQLDKGVFGVKKPALAFGTYDRIRNNLAANKGVVLGTGSFAKGFFKSLANAAKPKGKLATRTQPSGEVRNLHCYAVLDVDPKNLVAGDFESSIPDIAVTLRDPRDADGDTFTRTLKDIVTAGKFGTFSYEF